MSGAVSAVRERQSELEGITDGTEELETALITSGFTEPREKENGSNWRVLQASFQKRDE